MPTANGSVECTDNVTLVARFTIGESKYRLQGRISPAVTNFVTTRATLTYDSTSSLVGTKTCIGRLGIDEVDFDVGDDGNVSVNGALITPVRPAVRINGALVWDRDD